MITFLKEILVLLNFGTWPHLHYYNIILFGRQNFVGDVKGRNYDVIAINRIANFADIIKTTAMFIKTNFKDSKKCLKKRNHALKCTNYAQKLLIAGEKMLLSAELKRCAMWFTYFLDLL